MKTNIDKNIDIGWNFDNTYIHLPDVFYSKQEPIRVNSPKLVALNKTLGDFLGLDSNALESDEAVSILAGCSLAKGSSPIAQANLRLELGI